MFYILSNLTAKKSRCTTASSCKILLKQAPMLSDKQWRINPSFLLVGMRPTATRGIIPKPN